MLQETIQFLIHEEVFFSFFIVLLIHRQSFPGRGRQTNQLLH